MGKITFEEELHEASVQRYILEVFCFKILKIVGAGQFVKINPFVLVKVIAVPWT